MKGIKLETKPKPTRSTPEENLKQYKPAEFKQDNAGPSPKIQLMSNLARVALEDEPSLNIWPDLETGRGDKLTDEPGPSPTVKLEISSAPLTDFSNCGDKLSDKPDSTCPTEIGMECRVTPLTTNNKSELSSGHGVVIKDVSNYPRNYKYDF